MNKYSVVFTQTFEYEIEAEDECEAEELAYKEFESDMRHPVANTWYDDCEIEYLGECDEDDEHE